MLHCNRIKPPPYANQQVQGTEPMSRQLKLSATLSVLAMALFALAGGQMASEPLGLVLPHVGASAVMPALGDLLPSLQ